MLLLALALTSAAPRIVYAGGGWAAIDRGTTCEALTRSTRSVAKGQQQAVAGFAFDADRRRWGQFGVQLARLGRPGSSVIVELAGQSFLLDSDGTHAWSMSASQDQALIQALRSGAGMTLIARGSDGRRMTERFDGRGAATAIDSAAARCAGKTR
jgi:hypothetical protein